ncbi:MAG: class I SAM-dependent methyltransferase [Gaiellaceae bacterium]
MHSHPAYERTGFGAAYDRVRPAPPRALLDLLCDLLGRRPRLVVDLGSGTGLSTVVWSGTAERVVGVEANPEMLGAARAAGGVEYRRGDAAATGLEDGCADVVTCSQSLHWMDAQPTLAEAARILVPGGVFAAYDYELPPTIAPEVDDAFTAVLEEGGLAVETWRAEKLRELAEVRASGRFRFARDVFVHGRDEWDAERVVGFALSLGQVSRRLVDGESEAEIGLDRLRGALGGDRVPVWWSYDVVVGIR